MRNMPAMIEITRQLVGVNNVDNVKNTTRNDITSNDINRTKQIKNNNQLGLDRELTTKKSLGVNTRKDISSQTVKNKNQFSISDKINTFKKLFSKICLLISFLTI